MSNTIVYINENNELITENPTTTATDIGTNISKDLLCLWNINQFKRVQIHRN